MSIREEIRTTLVKGPASTDELLPQVPSCEGDRPRLSQNMSVLANEGKVRRCGLSDDGRPLFQLDPGAWPSSEPTSERTSERTAGRKPGPTTAPAEAAHRPIAKAVGKKKPQKTSAAKTPSPPKAQRPAAKTARKTAAKKPAAKRVRQPAAALDVKPQQGWLRQAPQSGDPMVGMLSDGSVFMLDMRDGTYSVIPPAVVRQILMFADRPQPALAA